MQRGHVIITEHELARRITTQNPMPNFHHRSVTVTTLDVGSPSSSSSGENWESFKILFHGFADLPSAIGQCTLSPEFTCNGHKWCLQINLPWWS
eukprot:scaffold7822_cov131-Skeletonema_menzelii.AAC.1